MKNGELSRHAAWRHPETMKMGLRSSVTDISAYFQSRMENERVRRVLQTFFILKSPFAIRGAACPLLTSA
jgi:hypothetical protein